MSPESGQPTAREIEDQLERMLASDRFRLADKQSPFLALVVKRALSGKKSPGHVIAKELFPDSVEKAADGKITITGNDVRTAAGNLRASLKRYYAQEGREDPVVISFLEPSKDRTVKLPEGEAYTPRFAYSALHGLPRELRLGNHHHRRGTVEDEEIALQHFAKVLEMCPDHVEAAIGIVEAGCLLLRWGEASDERRTELVRNAARVLNAAWARGFQYWRLYAAAGYLNMCLLGAESSEAAEYFGKAKALDRARTESYQPYIWFLLFSGQKDEALTLSRLYLDAHEDDCHAYIAHVEALLMSKRFEEAEAVLTRALAIDRSNVLAQYYVASLRTVQRRNQEALPHLEFLKLLVDHRSFGHIAERLKKRLGPLSGL